jgi:hypothetical protein
MEILEIRPARVKAALVAIGDMMVTSPLGNDGPKTPRWLGAVTEHVIVDEVDGNKVEPTEWRQWRLGLVDGQNTETKPVPADGWVWVHLPIVNT